MGEVFERILLVIYPPTLHDAADAEAIYLDKNPAETLFVEFAPAL